ncbi:anti-sigma factor [Zeimonas arvi]|uniref:Anti-sigma factor n=1 Tax=Zeimonas arvi TaxID=2498847 RepID=A0A5C8NRF1_9BURK|nr:anti-sigma factor [Zeimonas arvi]
MTNRPDRDDILAWVDERATGEQSSRVESWLAQDAEARDEALAWRSQSRALAGLGKQVLEEPVPQCLLDAARGAPAAMSADGREAGGREADGQAFGGPKLARPKFASPRFGGARFWLAAASLAALAWSAGWLSHAWLAPPASLTLATGPDVGLPADRGAPPGFVRDAVAAHAVFVPEVRHPVEVAAAQQEHLVQWLSKRLGARLTVPSLDAAGWSLVGGRLLPGEDGARAQFMYEDATGARITLYLADAGSASRDTAFRFETEGGVSAFYWVDGRFGYALAGQLERAAMLALAEEVYRQVAGGLPEARPN